MIVLKMENTTTEITTAEIDMGHIPSTELPTINDILPVYIE